MVIDMIGQKFGKLTVLEECEERSEDRQKIYLCECECGSYVGYLHDYCYNCDKKLNWEE